MTNEEMFTSIKTYVHYYDEHDCEEDDCDYDAYKEEEYDSEQGMNFSYKSLFTSEFFELNKNIVFKIPFENGSKIVVELEDGYDSIINTYFESYNTNDEFVPDADLRYRIADMYLSEHYRLII